MKHETNIEFYENRTLGERFSVTGDFILQKGKVLLKSTMYIALPLILLYGFLSDYYTRELLANIRSAPDYLNINWISTVAVVLVFVLSLLFLLSMTGAILSRYVKGIPTEKIARQDLTANVFPLMKKLLIQFLIVASVLILLTLLMGVLVYFSTFAGRLFTTVSVALILLAYFAALVVACSVLSLAPYPVLFEDATAWQGIKKGVRLGFKHWGSTFLSAFLGGLVLTALCYIVSMPYSVYVMFHMEEGGIPGYVFAFLSSFASFAQYVVFFIFMGFQYTSIVRKEERDPLQD